MLNPLNNGVWQPIQISRGGPKISHLFFADVVLLFCHAKNYRINLIMVTLDNFCEASGLKVNLQKFEAMGSSRIPRSKQSDSALLSQVSFVNDLGKYLGFPLNQGRVSKKHYDFIKSKAGWPLGRAKC